MRRPLQRRYGRAGGLAARWLVLSGGVASAHRAVIESRHRLKERAEYAARVLKSKGVKDVSVDHARAHEAALRGGTAAVQEFWRGYWRGERKEKS